MRPAAEALGLGLLHGPAELLPVSSSAHLALIGRAAHGDVAVAMHAGTALALLAGLRGEARAALRRRNVPFHLVAGAIPSVCGVLAEPRRSGSVLRYSTDAVGADRYSADAVGWGLAAGLLVGAAGLAWADRAPEERSRDDATLLDAAVLGVAQAAALWPGVSRSGATLAAARARRFTRPAAASLSRETGVPLLLGAAGYSAARGARGGSSSRAGEGCAPSFAAAAGSFAGTLAALALLRTLERPLWPWSAYRAGIALALVGRSVR